MMTNALYYSSAFSSSYIFFFWDYNWITPYMELYVTHLMSANGLGFRKVLVIKVA